MCRSDSTAANVYKSSSVFIDLSFNKRKNQKIKSVNANAFTKAEGGSSGAATQWSVKRAKALAGARLRVIITRHVRLRARVSLVVARKDFSLLQDIFFFKLRFIFLSMRGHVYLAPLRVGLLKLALFNAEASSDNGDTYMSI